MRASARNARLCGEWRGAVMRETAGRGMRACAGNARLCGEWLPRDARLSECERAAIHRVRHCRRAAAPAVLARSFWAKRGRPGRWLGALFDGFDGTGFDGHIFKGMARRPMGDARRRAADLASVPVSMRFAFPARDLRPRRGDLVCRSRAIAPRRKCGHPADGALSNAGFALRVPAGGWRAGRGQSRCGGSADIRQMARRPTRVLRFACPARALRVPRAGLRR